MKSAPTERDDLEAIETERGTIASLEAEIVTRTTAPLAEAEAFARLDRAIANADTCLNLDVRGCLDPLAPEVPEALLHWSIDASVRLDRVAFALAVRLNPKDVRTAARAAIVEWYRTAPAGLPARERQAAITDLRRQKFEAECREEAAIVATNAAGLFVARRPDADPKAVLWGVKDPHAKLRMLEEAAQQARAVSLDLMNRLQPVRDHLHHCQDDLRRVQAQYRHRRDVIPPSYENTVAAAQAEYDLLNQEQQKASARFQAEAAILPALRAALGTSGPQIRAA